MTKILISIGSLVRLDPTGVWVANHVQRYNVHLDQLREVQYGDG